MSQALLAIRERLGAGALTRREQDVQFLADLGTDLDRLKEGEASLPSLLEPLLGIEDCAGAEFSHWVDGSRARILGQARDALRGGLRAARSAGDLSRVHDFAVLLHGIDPLCADAVHALAERALLDGDTVAAVRLLKEQSRRAALELGTNPNPEIVQLLRRLERGERPGFRAQVSGIPAAMTRREVFVGREAEMSRLESLWERARGSGYQTCLVTGAPGIGKSSLVRRFATSLAARAWPAFVVPCQEIGQGIPYAAVSELVTALGRDTAAGGTDPQWLAEASRVCPGLKAVYPGIPDPPKAPTDSIRLRVAEALLRMMEEVSDHGPMLVAFDDVQHMDPASREVLFLVTRRLEEVPFVILATSRPDSVAEAASSESGRGGLAWAETIALEPLQRDQAMRLLHDLLSDGEDIDSRIRETIVRLAQGNPYFVEMLLSDWRQHEARSLVAAETDGDRTILSWSPPETLRTAFERLYRGLSAESQHLLQLLAVAERAMSTPEVAPLLGLESTQVERAVLEMLDRGMGRVESGRVAFKNELHRAYVYYAMGDEQRCYFHTRVAEWLWRGAPSDDFQRVLEASHHFITARMEAEACETALAGAELAVRRGAPGEAERALSALLRSYPQDIDSRVHVVLANALVAEGEYREAIDALCRWCPRDPAPNDEAHVAQIRAEALHRACLADEREILEAATMAVSVARESGTDLTLIRALQIRAEVAAECGTLGDAEDAAARAQVVADKGPNPECKALAALTRGYGLLVAGRLEGAVAAFSDAVPLLRDLNLLVELRRALNGLGMCHTGLAQLPQAVEYLHEAIRVAQRIGSPAASCNTWTNLAIAYHEGGFYYQAQESQRRAEAFLGASGISRQVTALYASAARLATEMGHFEQAERYCALAVASAKRSGAWRLLVQALGATADLCLARSEPESAWPLVQQAISLAHGRSQVLDDEGQYERLRRHLVWVTEGYNAIAEIRNGKDRLAPCSHLEDKLQVSAFDEWIDQVEGRGTGDEAGAQEIVRRGLFGSLSRLAAVGVRFQTISQPQAAESSAQLVARVFQPERRLALPGLDEFLRPCDAPLNSA